MHFGAIFLELDSTKLTSRQVAAQRVLTEPAQSIDRPTVPLEMPDYCVGVASANVIGVSSGALCLGAFYVVNSALAFYWIYQQRSLAQKGYDGASKYVIFPIYMPFMWLSAITDILVGLAFFFLNVQLHEPNNWAMSISVALVIALQHLVLEGISFALLQYGCGYQAARRSTGFACIWGFLTFLLQMLCYYFGNSSTESFVAQEIWGGVLLLFYFLLIALPEKRLYRRPAIKLYAKFWFIFRIICVYSETLVWYADTHASASQGLSDAASCSYAVGVLFLFAACKPYLVYRVLLEDSKWWQGILSHVGGDAGRDRRSSLVLGGIDFFSLRYASVGSPGGGYSSVPKSQGGSNTIHNNKEYDSLQNPLVGIEVGFSEAQDLAQEVDNLCSDGAVRLINFAYVTLDESCVLGAGSFSKVYAGKYKGSKVAIKMLFTPDINLEIIKRTRNEAMILSNFSGHSNVVKIIGVTVLPPSLCIVLEMCKFGSLSDVLRGCDTGNSATRKSPLKLTNADKMYLALGCARGLAALHDFSPYLCHRDIKSYNFLVDYQFNAKIADLELGADGGGLKKSEGGSVQTFFDVMYENGMTLTWQAPEVLHGAEYAQHSDVYSLCLVLWEIVSAPLKRSSGPASAAHNHDLGIPYSEYSTKQVEVCTLIKRGVRPTVLNNCAPASYIECVRRGWSEDVSLRPTSQQIVAILQCCWMQCCHRYISQTSHIVDYAVIADTVNDHKASEYKSLSLFAVPSSASAVSEGGRLPPKKMVSERLFSALSCMKQESGWERLNDEGAFLIFTPPPMKAVWATKKWTLLTGFVWNDILCCELSFLAGSSTDMLMVDKMLSTVKRLAEISNGCHVVTPLYRSDGTAFDASLHAFPIFRTEGVEGAGRELAYVAMQFSAITD